MVHGRSGDTRFGPEALKEKNEFSPKAKGSRRLDQLGTRFCDQHDEPVLNPTKVFVFGCFFDF